MEILSDFLKNVLDVLEPDVQNQQSWLEQLSLYAPSQSAKMMAFKARIQQAIENKEKVLVAGDYDCDGVMATSIMVSGLRSLGLDVGFYIPNRITEGYGLQQTTVLMAADKGYSLIITVDNGVSAHSSLMKAKELGLDVIVTDHHTFEEEPVCSILIHPAKLEEPFEYLCGAGIAYECMRVLQVHTSQHLMWAAIASIADCMVVQRQTRAIIQQGIKLLNTQSEMHINALSRKTKYNEEDLAFQVIPMINAVGRLANMANVNNVVRFFLNNDIQNTAGFAAKMEHINTIRKQMSQQTSAKAQALVKISHPVLLAADSSFHEGVIGLVAGSLCSQYQKPVIVGSLDVNGVKCSMRSPAGFDCMAFLKQFDSYIALGGHKQAAGFTISLEEWERFKKFVFTQGLATPWQPAKEVQIPVDCQQISVENIQSLDLLRPFGTGFEKPKFVIENPQIRGIFDLSGGKHRKYALDNGVCAIHFNQTESDMAKSVLRIQKLTGSLSINEYQGRKTPNFIVDEIEYK